MSVESHECPPDHKHAATSTCYIVHRCRCRPCRYATSARERARTAAKRAGTYDSGLVDAEPVREHLEMLRASGLGWKRIAALAGVGDTAVCQLIYGRKAAVADPRHGERLKRVSRRTAEAILAVQPSLELLGRAVLVPSRPYARRLQALVAIGWSGSQLARMLGSTPTNFRLLREYEADPAGARVTVSTARAVVALYERLALSRPPAATRGQRAAVTRSIAYAAARGWPRPMDWAAVDDDFDRAVLVRRSA